MKLILGVLLSFAIFTSASCFADDNYGPFTYQCDQNCHFDMNNPADRLITSTGIDFLFQRAVSIALDFDVSISQYSPEYNRLFKTYYDGRRAAPENCGRIGRRYNDLDNCSAEVLSTPGWTAWQNHDLRSLFNRMYQEKAPFIESELLQDYEHLAPPVSPNVDRELRGWIHAVATQFRDQGGFKTWDKMKAEVSKLFDLYFEAQQH